jgi:hypothetical protein
MSYAQRILSASPPAGGPVPGRYDRSLRVYADGRPVVVAGGLEATKADIDRPRAGLKTSADVDRPRIASPVTRADIDRPRMGLKR